MENKKVKTPADYPLLSFRVTKEEKQEILELIEKAKLLLNKKRKKDEKIIRGNDVFLKALRVGLSQINKK